MASKQLERVYVEGFLNAFPMFELVKEHEAPDFVMRDANGLIGMELVQVFVDAASGGSTTKKRESMRQRTLTELACRYYAIGGRPLKVTATTPTSTLGDLDSLARRLVAQGPARPWTTKRMRLGSDGTVLHLTSLPASAGQYQNWSCASNAVGWVKQSCEDSLLSAILAKAAKLPSYRRAVDRVALLLVADSTQASGMISLSRNDVGSVVEGFDAVYFYRHPIGAVQLSSNE